MGHFLVLCNQLYYCDASAAQLYVTGTFWRWQATIYATPNSFVLNTNILKQTTNIPAISDSDMSEKHDALNFPFS